ncbi:carbohydrate ABC transporter permease [Paenibacillus psychroresistens]|uniref:Carbohydrate ABC transporter permease n=1 Tax=Paenibacillus psychroresistens TaxID=1778678 RepID=A0A6B8RG90_9BACL|nr:carbohydrate ABC transporter permease [Paenibacillus psychroresistens]QGQ95200.1 carbohydrate ABC transporter permease [Paenibacillus psychroresistens]
MAVGTKKWRLWLIELIVMFFGLLVFFPFVLLIVTSFKTDRKVFDFLNVPDFTYFDNFAKVLKQASFFQSLGNTVYITGISILLLIAVSSMAGYAISRGGGKLFGIMLMVLLSGMIIPVQVSMVPLFKMGIALGLSNTRTMLVLLYTAINIPFAAFIYVGFTKTIPRELEEAGKIDGCNRFNMFWRIIFPLLLPATGTVVVTTIFPIWNDFQYPLIFLRGDTKQTLISLIFSFRGQYSTEWGPVFALCLLSTLPLVALFLLVQKQFFKQVTGGALKG